jgi:hypothetical protein
MQGNLTVLNEQSKEIVTELNVKLSQQTDGLANIKTVLALYTEP